MLTVGRLARKYGLSRSTLLYYDSIGLLKPDDHDSGEYRRYSKRSEEKLKQICRYREYGLSLKEIRALLEGGENSVSDVLLKRFNELTDEITRLRNQQKLIVGVLKNKVALDKVRIFDRKSWTQLLKMSGFSEEDMIAWHVEFEKTSPDKHTSFLQFLGFSQKEIRSIRAWITKGGEHEIAPHQE